MQSSRSVEGTETTQLVFRTSIRVRLPPRHWGNTCGLRRHYASTPRGRGMRYRADTQDTNVDKLCGPTLDKLVVAARGSGL